MPVTSLNGSNLNKSLKARRGKVSVPAPAVIPALLAYIEVDAVKKLVVGVVRLEEKMLCGSKDSWGTPPIHWVVRVRGQLRLLPSLVYFEEIGVFIAVVLTEQFSMG